MIRQRLQITGKNEKNLCSILLVLLVAKKRNNSSEQDEPGRTIMNIE